MLHVGRIVPVYRLTRGLTARTLRQAIRGGLDRFGPYPEYLPPDIVAGQPAIGEAVEAAHFPDDFAQRDAAVRRLAHDELLALQVGMVSRRRQRRGQVAPGHRGRRRHGPGAAGRPSRPAWRRRVGRPVVAHRRPAAAMDAIRADLGRGPSRCCASSRATSARARRPWPPMPWRWRRDAGGQARAAGTDRPAGAPAGRAPWATCSSGARRAGHAADGLAQRGRTPLGRWRPSPRGRRPVVVGTHALLQAVGRLRAPGARGRRRAAPLRRRAAGGARGQGRRRRTSCS